MLVNHKDLLAVLSTLIHSDFNPESRFKLRVFWPIVQLIVRVMNWFQTWWETFCCSAACETQTSFAYLEVERKMDGVCREWEENREHIRRDTLFLQHVHTLPWADKFVLSGCFPSENLLRICCRLQEKKSISVFLLISLCLCWRHLRFTVFMRVYIQYMFVFLSMCVFTLNKTLKHDSSRIPNPWLNRGLLILSDDT